MITKISDDEFNITNVNPLINITLTFDEMLDRLTKNGVWSSQQVEELKKLEDGESTKPPYAIYWMNDVPHSSHNGIMGKPL